MNNNILLSSKELHRTWYTNIKTILDFLHLHPEILSDKIQLEVENITNSILFILENSNIHKPDFAKINKHLEKSKLKTEISCDFITKIEKILSKELDSFKDLKLSELEEEINLYKELINSSNDSLIKEKISLIREKKELEKKIKKIKGLNESIKLIESSKEKYLEELNKISIKESLTNSGEPKIELEETVLIIKSPELQNEIVKDKDIILDWKEKQDEEIDKNLYYKNFYSKKIEEIKDFYNLCMKNNKKEFLIASIQNLWKNKWNTYLKLEIILFFINENFDTNYIKNNLFKGIAWDVNVENDKEYKLFEKISILLFPQRKSIKYDPANILNDYDFIFKYLQNFLERNDYKWFIKQIYKINNNWKWILDYKNLRLDLYDLLVKNKWKIENLYQYVWNSKEYRKLFGVILKSSTITGDFNFLIKDFSNLQDFKQVNVISQILQSDYYLGYIDILKSFYPIFLSLDETLKNKDLIELYRIKVFTNN